MEVLENNILVIQTAFLGDAVLTLPLIQKLNEVQPHSNITVLCIPSTKEVFLNSPYVKDVIVYDKRGTDKSILSYIELIINVRSRKFSKVISPHRSIRSTLISFLSGAKETIGFSNADSSFLYKKQVIYRKEKHEVERNLSLLNEDAITNSWKILPEINIGEEASEKIDNVFSVFNEKKVIAIAPGSVWKTKIYPKENFEELIRLITSQGFFVALIGGNEDAELCNSISRNVESEIFSFAGSLSIIESIAFLKRCSALVCNDSAPTHLAMAADIPVLTIYCSTIPGFGFYPYNRLSAFISFDELDCKPCGIHGHQTCPIKTFDCAFKLKPEMVFNKLKQILPA